MLARENFHVKEKILSVPADVHRTLQKMERLMEINITLNSTLELKQVLDLIIAKAVEMLECEVGQGSAPSFHFGGAPRRARMSEAERQAEELFGSLLSEAFHE